jgi:hypothetical protein
MLKKTMNLILIKKYPNLSLKLIIISLIAQQKDIYIKEENENLLIFNSKECSILSLLKGEKVIQLLILF